MVYLQSVPLRVGQPLDTRGPRKHLVDAPVRLQLVAEAHHLLFLSRQEPGVAGCARECKEEQRRDANGDDTLDDEERAPRREVGARVDLRQAVGKEATERAGGGAKCKDGRRPLAALRLLVDEAEVDVDAGD